jgi:hypothetical protein
LDWRESHRPAGGEDWDTRKVSADVEIFDLANTTAYAGITELLEKCSSQAAEIYNEKYSGGDTPGIKLETLAKIDKARCWYISFRINGAGGENAEWFKFFADMDDDRAGSVWVYISARRGLTAP